MPVSQVSTRRKPAPVRGLAVRSSRRLRLLKFLIPSLSVTASLEGTTQGFSHGTSLWAHHVSPLILYSLEYTLTSAISERRESQSASPAPDIFELAKGGEEEGAQAEAQEQLECDGAREQVSAADYDPSLDRREDEQRRVRGAKEELNQDVEMIEEDEDDDDDVDDMFALFVADKKKKIKKVKKVIVCRVSHSFLTTLIFVFRNPVYRLSLRQRWILPQTLKAIIKSFLASTSMVVVTKYFPPLGKACLPTLCVLGCSRMRPAMLVKKSRSR